MRQIYVHFMFVFLLSTLLIPVASAEILFASNFSINSGVPQNESIGFITEFENGGFVLQDGNQLHVSDPGAGENGFRVQFTNLNVTENVYYLFRMYTNETANGFGGVGLTNCTVNDNMGHEEMGSCDSEGNFNTGNAINFAPTNNVRVVNTLVGTFTSGVPNDYVVFINRTNLTFWAYQDGVFLGGQVVTAVSVPTFYSGMQMQSGGGSGGDYVYDHICVWTESTGDETFQCPTIFGDPDTSNPSTASLANDVAGFADTDDIVNFSVTLLDDLNLASYIFGTNDTGTFVNESPVVVTGTSQDVSELLTVTAISGQFVCGEFYVTDGTGKTNSSGLSCFSVTPPPPEPLPLANLATIVGMIFMFLIVVSLTFKGAKK